MALYGPETTRRPEGFPFQRNGEIVPLLPTSTLPPAWLGRAASAMGVAKVLASANESDARYEMRHFPSDDIEELNRMGEAINAVWRPEAMEAANRDFPMAA